MDHLMDMLNDVDRLAASVAGGPMPSYAMIISFLDLVGQAASAGRLTRERADLISAAVAPAHAPEHLDPAAHVILWATCTAAATGDPGRVRYGLDELASALDRFAEHHDLLPESEVAARELEYIRVLDEFDRDLGNPVSDDVFRIDLRVRRPHQ